MRCLLHAAHQAVQLAQDKIGPLSQGMNGGAGMDGLMGGMQ